MNIGSKVVILKGIGYVKHIWKKKKPEKKVEKCQMGENGILRGNVYLKTGHTVEELGMAEKWSHPNFSLVSIFQSCST